MPAGIFVKAIKPKRLKDAEMKRELYNGMKRFGRRGVDEFKKTIETWEGTTPEFIYRVALHGESRARSGPGPTTRILLSGDEEGVQKWNWLDRGTEEHEIWAGYYTGKSDKKSLAFSSDFTPKTPVGSVFPGAGHEGAIDTFVPYVHHPGTAPRELRKRMVELLKPAYLSEMEEAMRRAVRVSGHAIK